MLQTVAAPESNWCGPNAACARISLPGSKASMMVRFSFLHRTACWESPFDLGRCTVSIEWPFSPPLFDAVLMGDIGAFQIYV